MLSRVRNISLRRLSQCCSCLPEFSLLSGFESVIFRFHKETLIKICQKFIFHLLPFLKKKSEKFSLGNPYGGFPSNLADIPTETKISYIRFVTSSRLKTREKSSDQKGVSVWWNCKEKISAYGNKLGNIGNQTDGSQWRNNAAIYVRSTPLNCLTAFLNVGGDSLKLSCAL